MAGVMRYKFIKLADNGIEAIFEWTSDQGLQKLVDVIRKAITGEFDTKVFNEKWCKFFYEDACSNDYSGNGASPKSRDDLRHAFYAIRAYKQEHGIPFDTEDDLQ